jgi:hypothetical protein
MMQDPSQFGPHAPPAEPTDLLPAQSVLCNALLSATRDEESAQRREWPHRQSDGDQSMDANEGRL